MHEGSCLCGAVTFEIDGPLPGPDACHCRQCRKQSGHFFTSSDIPKSSLKIQSGEDKVSWYQSSERVRRGFCSVCGSSLFWDPVRRDTIGVAMGSIDTPTRTQLRIHIFVEEKGDYYEIADGLPQNQR
jgi:hypothetical protein